MSTATDWDVRDAATDDRLSVTDVAAALSLDGAATDAPALTLDDAHRLAVRNSELTEQLRHAEAENYRQAQMLEQLVTEVSELRAELHPLDARRTGWTPGPKAMPRKHWTEVHGVDDLTEQQQRAALVAPTLPELRDGDQHYSGAPIAAEIVSGVDAKPGWPTWLGQVHHADAAWADIVTRLRAMPDTYAATPVERTLVEPVEIDYSYRETEAALWAQTVVSLSEQHDPGVYGELAPERLDEQALVPTGAPERHDPPRRDDEPDRSDVEAMAEGRRRRDTLAARSSDDAVTTPRRRPWWTRYGDLIAGAAIGVAAFAALGVAWVTGVLR